MLRQNAYGVAVVNLADLDVFDAPDEVMALRRIAPVLMAYKRGLRTVTRQRPVLHRPA